MKNIANHSMKTAFRLLLSSALLLVAATPLAAASRTWTGGTPGDQSCAKSAGTNLWTISCNWSGQASPAAADDLSFPVSLQSTSTNNYAAGTTFNSLNVTTAHTIGGAAIALNTGITASAGVIQLASIKLNADQFFNAASPNGASNVLINSPIDTNGKVLSLANGLLTSTGVISGSGAVRKTAGGIAQLLGNNTYTGATTISQGTLLVFGSQPQSNVTISGNDNSDQTLGGSGTVGAITVENRRTAIDPGPANHGTGILTANGNVVFQSGGIGRLRIDLAGRTAGSGYDQLKLGSAATLTLGSGIVLTVTFAGGFVPNAGDTFLIVNNAGPAAIGGTFAGRPEGALLTVSGITFQISYHGGDGNDVTLTAVSGSVSFSSASYSVNEGGGTAALVLTRTGGGNTTAAAAVTLQDVSTNSADYVFAPGTLDPSLNPGSGPDASVAAVAVQPDGKILVSGGFLSFGGASRKRIARLNPDGSVDPTFDSSAGADDRVTRMVLQPDGKILIIGRFFNYGTTARHSIARLNSDGSLDAGFDPAAGTDGVINGLALQPDGKIIIAGDFTKYRGVARIDVARLNSDGTLDTSFNPGAGVNGLIVFAVAIDADGKILIGGDFTIIDPNASPRLVRLNSNGTNDASFTPGTGPNDLVKAISIGSDGKILIGGQFTSYNGTARGRLARLASTGALDTNFAKAGADEEILDLAQQADGKAIIVGNFEHFRGDARVGVARLDADGFADPSFNVGTGASSTVSAVAVQSDGKIVIAGGFSDYNGVPRNNVARLRGDLVAVWGPNDLADKTIQLPIVDDVLAEGDEKLNLQLLPLKSGLPGSRTSAELTIIDNDAQPTPTPSASPTPTPDPTATPTPEPTATPDPTPTPDPTATPTATPLPTASPSATPAPSPTAEPTVSPTPSPGSSPTVLANLSTRLRVSSGDDALIGGFIITGNEPKKVVLRAIGPSLDLAARLQNPTLELFDADQQVVAFNDNWNDAPNRQEIIDTGIAPANDLESVILITLAPGNYTAAVRDLNDVPGIGVVEVYDLNTAADSTLANIATRGVVGTGDEAMIGGFIIVGQTAQKVILRAIGPSLPVAGQTLTDPTLELRNADGEIVRGDDDWRAGGQQAEIEAVGIPPSDDRESALIETLGPGSYTAVVRGVNEGTGIAVVEVYALD